MQPYTLINHLLNDMIHDSLQAEFIRLNFADNIRFDHAEYARGCHGIPWNDPMDTVRRNNKSPVPVYHMHAWNKTNWNRNAERQGVPVYLEHQWEPINVNLDSVFWNTFTEWKQKFDAPYTVLHSEHRSKDIAQLQAQGINTVHWFAHAYICSEFYFKHYPKINMVTDYKSRPINYPWLCANRLLRNHRTDFLELLDLDQGCYSLLNPDPNGLTYTGPVSARSFDSHANSSAEINVEELTPWNTSFLHVVSETVWQDKIHFTEKVFKPIVMHQPFVVLQAPGSLEYLRSYGFKTFGDFWDESYDRIVDPVLRMQAVADIVNTMPHQNLYALREQMAGVLEHNFRHFYEILPAICLNELSVGLSLIP